MREKIAKFIDESVEALTKSEATNCRYILDDRLAIFIGWSDCRCEDLSDDIIKSSEDANWCATIAIKVHTSDYLWCDFDYLNYPYYEDGECCINDILIGYNYDANNLADYMLKEYDVLKKLKITKNGLIIEEKENK